MALPVGEPRDRGPNGGGPVGAEHGALGLVVALRRLDRLAHLEHGCVVRRRAPGRSASAMSERSMSSRLARSPSTVVPSSAASSASVGVLPVRAKKESRSRSIRRPARRTERDAQSCLRSSSTSAPATRVQAYCSKLAPLAGSKRSIASISATRPPTPGRRRRSGRAAPAPSATRCSAPSAHRRARGGRASASPGALPVAPELLRLGRGETFGRGAESRDMSKCFRRETCRTPQRPYRRRLSPQHQTHSRSRDPRFG